jgi:hypothetical protein
MVPNEVLDVNIPAATRARNAVMLRAQLGPDSLLSLTLTTLIASLPLPDLSEADLQFLASVERQGIVLSELHESERLVDAEATARKEEPSKFRKNHNLNDPLKQKVYAMWLLFQAPSRSPALVKFLRKKDTHEYAQQFPTVRYRFRVCMSQDAGAGQVTFLDPLNKVSRAVATASVAEIHRDNEGGLVLLAYFVALFCGCRWGSFPLNLHESYTLLVAGRGLSALHSTIAEIKSQALSLPVSPLAAFMGQHLASHESGLPGLGDGNEFCDPESWRAARLQAGQGGNLRAAALASLASQGGSVVGSASSMARGHQSVSVASTPTGVLQPPSSLQLNAVYMAMSFEERRVASRGLCRNCGHPLSQPHRRAVSDSGCGLYRPHWNPAASYDPLYIPCMVQKHIFTPLDDSFRR